MSLLFCDGFQDWDMTTLTEEGWTKTDVNNAISIGAGRRAGSSALWFAAGASTTNGARIFRSPEPNTANYGPFCVHFALYVSALPSAQTTIFSVRNGGSMASSIFIGSSGSIGYTRATTNHVEAASTITVESALGVITAGRWHTVEMRVSTLGVGDAYLRVNSVQVASSLGLTVAGGGFTAWNSFSLGTAPSFASARVIPSMRIADFVILIEDGIGASGFQGPMEVHTVRPNGAGDSTQFTPSAGSNWQCVDEVVGNGDTDFVDSSTAGHIDLYALEDLSIDPSSIKGVLLKATAMRTDNGARTLQLNCKSSAVATNVGQVLSLSSAGYTTVHAPVGRDPNGNVAWTKAAVDALQAGYVVG